MPGGTYLTRQMESIKKMEQEIEQLREQSRATKQDCARRVCLRFDAVMLELTTSSSSLGPVLPQDTIIKNLKSKAEAAEKHDRETSMVKSDAEIKVKCLAANLACKEAILKDLRHRMEASKETSASSKVVVDELEILKLQLEETKKELTMKVKRVSGLSDRLRETTQVER